MDLSVGCHTGTSNLSVMSKSSLVQASFLCTSQVGFQLDDYCDLFLILLGQQEMTLVVCAPLCANGHILVMHKCRKSMKKIPEIWKLVDGMMTSGRRLD